VDHASLRRRGARITSPPSRTGRPLNPHACPRQTQSVYARDAAATAPNRRADGGVARKDNPCAVRRPGWIVVIRSGAAREVRLGIPIGIHDEDPSRKDATTGKGDPCAVRRPSWPSVAVSIAGQVGLCAPVRIHHEDVVERGTASAREGDPRAVGRPCGREVPPCARRQVRLTAAVGVHDEDVHIGEVGTRKTILVPSGDQAGSVSSAAFLLRLITPSPLRLLTRISCLKTPRAKAILVPSGDQAGCSSGALLLVSCLDDLPLAFMTKRSPSRSKTILRPSGDQDGE
jgi:hypothetical protein